MGLRLVAHYYDRSEAFVARSVIEAQGMLAILHNEDWLRMQPYYLGPLGGYRLVVSDIDLDDAVSLLREAQLNPILEGERLELDGNLVERVLGLMLGWFSGGVPTSLRQSRWIAFEDE